MEIIIYHLQKEPPPHALCWFQALSILLSLKPNKWWASAPPPPIKIAGSNHPVAAKHTAIQERMNNMKSTVPLAKTAPDWSDTPGFRRSPSVAKLSPKEPLSLMDTHCNSNSATIPQDFSAYLIMTLTLDTYNETNRSHCMYIYIQGPIE